MFKKASILLITFSFSALIIAGIFLYYLTETEPTTSLFEEKRPNEGYYVDYYEDGTIKAEEHYANGMKDGIWKNYYPDGRLKDLMKFTNGKLQGEKKHYSITGELVFTEKYTNDILVDMTIWDDSLYRYEANIINHGKYVYSIDCQPCHEGFKEASILQMDSLKLISDTSSIKYMVLDSLHKPYLLPEIEGNDSTLVEENCLFVFNKKYDLKAVLEYIKKYKVKKDAKKLKMKKLKIRSKTS